MAGRKRGVESYDWLSDLKKAKALLHEVEQLPDTLALADLAKKCKRDEAVLRLQYRSEGHEYAAGGKGRLPAFPDAWELGLGRPGRSAATMHGALSRWGYLIHLWSCHREGLKPATDPATSEERNSLRDLLKREPIQVFLPHRTVEVTGRSYAALELIAQHSLRLRQLQLAAMRFEEVERRLMTQIAILPRRSTKARRRKLRDILRRHEWVVIESGFHRQGIFANAFTEDGRPAEGLHEAPEWWVEVTPQDDAELLTAMFQVGHQRVADVRQEKGQEDEDEDAWGWFKLFSTVERIMKAPMASLINEDLFQLQAWVMMAESTSDDLEP